MKEFTYYVPTKVVFGKGAEAKTAAEVREFGGSRVLVVYGGGSVVRSGLLQRIEDQLKEAGLAVESIGGVQPNPRVALAREGVAKAIAFGADFILAVGGGSVIDTAKAIAHGTANPGCDVWNDIWLGKVALTKSLPVGVVLTISAAGSETSDSAVLTDEESNSKRGINTPFNRPRFAVMDPVLTYTLPKFQITCGCVDIMMHTMDRYFTPIQGNDLTDRIAASVLRTVIENAPKALEDPTDYDAMSEIMWCGSLSHNDLTGLGGQKDFTPHKLGHELSAMFDVAHGASLSAIWGSWAAYSWHKDPERFQKFGRDVWGIAEADPAKAAEETIRTTVEFFRSLDMPTCFSELGIGVLSDEVLHQLANHGTRGNSIKLGCFLPLDEQGAYEVYKLANR